MVVVHAVSRRPADSDAGAIAIIVAVFAIVMFTLAQPPHVDVNEVLVRPTAQSL